MEDLMDIAADSDCSSLEEDSLLLKKFIDMLNLPYKDRPEVFFKIKKMVMQ